MMGLPTCRDVAAELSREQDAPRRDPRPRSMTLHLMMCRHCRRYARQLAWMQQALTLARTAEAEAPRLPAAARARIRARLHDADPRPPV